MKFKSVCLSILCVFLFNCTSLPEEASVNASNNEYIDGPEQIEAQVSADDKTIQGLDEKSKEDKIKSENLSEYKTTTIQTSNGLITIEPTVVATTDAAVSTNDNSDNMGPEAQYSDPLEFINRPIFAFNHVAYTYALIPLANGYNAVVPQPVRKSVTNVFDNIREPLNLVNNTLTGDIGEAGINLGRFLINSTIGILGLFDPATAWFDIEAKPQNLAQTLMRYNVGSGAYIVLPLLGQSDIRNTASILGEGLVHPINYALDSPGNTVARGVDGFDDLSQQTDTYRILYEGADDPYIYFRNQYIQSINRDELYLDKKTSEVNIPGATGND